MRRFGISGLRILALGTQVNEYNDHGTRKL